MPFAVRTFGQLLMVLFISGMALLAGVVWLMNSGAP